MNNHDHKFKRALSTLSIVGTKSEELLLNHDDEDVQDICLRYFTEVKGVVERNGGRIYQHLDNSIIAIFGTQIHTEKHALAAFNTAKEIFLSHKIPDETDLRMGIDSGECIVNFDDIDATYKSVMGDSVLFASHISCDLKDYILAISAAAVELVGEKFKVKTRKDSVKYRDRRISVYYMEDFDAGVPSSAPIKLQFVGRDAELAVLKNAFSTIRSIEGPKNIFISGAPGQGKTRLIQEFLHSFGRQSYIALHPFFPSGIEGNEFLKDILEKALILIGIERIESSAEFVEYIAHYFSLKNPIRLSALKKIILNVSDKNWQGIDVKSKSHICAATVNEILCRLSLVNPFIIIFEDVHWAHKTYNLLKEELFQRENSNLLFIQTSRNKLETSEWKDAVQCLEIGDLQPCEVQVITQSLFNESDDFENIVRFLSNQSGGNPLYLLEIVRFLSTNKNVTKINEKFSFTDQLDKISVPLSLKSIVEHQVLALEKETQEMLIVISALDMPCKYNVLSFVLGQQTNHLKNILDDLCRAGFLEFLNGDLEETCIFKHALIQQLIYESILKKRKKEVHGQIFKELHKNYLCHKFFDYEALANHAFSAQKWREAYHYSYKNTLRLFKKYDFVAASKALKICIECNDTFSAKEKAKIRRSIKLRIMLCQSLLMLADFKEMKPFLTDIQSFINRSIASPNLIDQYISIRTFYDWIFADYHRSIKIMENYLSSRSDENDPVYVTCLVRYVGMLSDIGQYRESNSHINLSSLEYIKDQDRTYGLAFPALGVCHAIKARNFAFTGDKVKANAEITNSLRVAESQNVQSSKIFSFCFCAEALMILGQHGQAISLIKDAENLSEIYKVDILSSYIKSIYGLLKIYENDPSGIILMKQAITLAEKEGRRCRLSSYYHNLGTGLLALGDFDQARRVFLISLRLSRRYKEEGVEARTLLSLLKMQGQEGLNRAHKKQLRTATMKDRLSYLADQLDLGTIKKSLSMMKIEISQAS